MFPDVRIRTQLHYINAVLDSLWSGRRFNESLFNFTINRMSLDAIKIRLINDGFHSDQECIQDLTTIFDNFRSIYKPKQERDNANEFERCFFARLSSLP